MKIKTQIVAIAAAIAALSAGNSFAYADGGSLVTLTSSTPFANSARGEFNNTRNASLSSSSSTGVTLTNVAMAFSSFSFGAIRELSATANRDSHFGASAPTTSSFYTLPSQMRAGRTTLPSGPFASKVSGSGVFNGETSYASNMGTSPGPQPETLTMLLASLGLMGAIALRRIKANTD